MPTVLFFIHFHILARNHFGTENTQCTFKDKGGRIDTDTIMATT